MMKSLTLEQTHQLLNNLQLLNVCCKQFGDLTTGLKQDDPIRVAATSIIEGAEDFKGLELQVDEQALEKAEVLFGQIVSLQAAVNARTQAH